jgi:hypothetical protein
LINRKNDYSPGACSISWALGETPSITVSARGGGISTLMARGLFVTVRGNFQHSFDAGMNPRVASSASLENPKGAKGLRNADCGLQMAEFKVFLKIRSPHSAFRN